MLPPKGCEQVGVQRDAPTYDRWACGALRHEASVAYRSCGPWTRSKGHGPAGACRAGVARCFTAALRGRGG